VARRKEILPVRSFLGINTYNDEYDLKNEEFRELYNLVNDRVGILRTAGQLDIVTTKTNCGVIRGYNLGTLGTESAFAKTALRQFNGIVVLSSGAGRITFQARYKVSRTTDSGTTIFSNFKTIADDPLDDATICFEVNDYIWIVTNTGFLSTYIIDVDHTAGTITVMGEYDNVVEVNFYPANIVSPGDMLLFDFPGALSGYFRVEEIEHANIHLRAPTL